MRILFVLAALMFALPATAATLEVDREACKMLTTHRPLPNVDYQAGVDAHGNDVAPADLTPGIALGDTFTIPITVDIGQQLGIGMLSGTEATVAMVTVDGDKVYLDGRPLTPEQEDNLSVLCLEDDTQ